MSTSAEPARTSGDPAVSITTLDPDDGSAIDLVARRMRSTLVEVLDEGRADDLFTHAELVERVRWHLDTNVPDRRSEVYLASIGTSIAGHTMVRAEVVDGEELGLFATTYVIPEARRSGVASALLRAGEDWMRGVGLQTAATFTDARNDRLLAFYSSHGYECLRIDSEWATARRALG